MALISVNKVIEAFDALCAVEELEVLELHYQGMAVLTSLPDFTLEKLKLALETASPMLHKACCPNDQAT